MIVSSRCFILSALLLIGLSIHAQEINTPKEIFLDTIHGRLVIDTDLSLFKDTIQPLSSVKIDLSSVKFTNELSVLEFLQGRVSGLDISNVSTDPGVSAQAVLRGQNFTGYRIPLIVIDGIPQQSLGNIFNSLLYGFKNITNLIPVPLADIESIEVLKDGAATALYGAEGANGVILIETKKGSRQKLSLSYEFNQSFVNSPSYMPMLNGKEYLNYQLEAWHNSYGDFDIPAELNIEKGNKNYYNYTANTDWMKAVTQAGSAANHQLSFSGGNQKNRLFGSVNYRDEMGTTINTGTKRFLNRLNFEHDFSRKLTLALNTSFGYNKADGNKENILNIAFIKAPHVSIWKHDAVGVVHGDYFEPTGTYQGNFYSYPNPVAVSENSHTIETAKDLMATSHLLYRPYNWLQFRETFSYNKLSSANEMSTSNTITEKGYEQFRNEIQAFIKVPFKDQRINSLGGIFSWIKQVENISNTITTKSDKNVYDTSKESFDRNRKAVISSVSYQLYGRYIIMANARMESNSLIFDSEKWDHFYGASLAWRFSEEPFFKNLKLDNGKVHVGWSDMEYQPDPGFSAYDYFSDKHPYIDPIFGSGYTNPYYGVTMIIQVPSYEAGFEIGMFKNRLNISGDYYCKNPESITSTSRKSSTLKLEVKGWEGTIDYTIISKENFNWSLQFNMAHNSQKLVKMTNLNNIKEGLGRYNNDGYSTYIAEGKSFGSIYGFLREGVYASDEDAVARDREGNIYYNNGQPLMMSYDNFAPFKGGDTKYKDINYDGKINENDLVYLGNAIPEFTGGFGSTIRYKNLTLTCNFHYRTGNELINQTAYNAEGLNNKNSRSKKVLNRWRVQGQQGPDLMPKAYLNRSSNYLPSDLYVESGSFARLNYLNLGYSFGPTVSRKLHVKDLSLNLSGQRLYTCTNYSGLNPETEISSNYMTELNKDNSKISPPKVYTISLRVTI